MKKVRPACQPDRLVLAGTDSFGQALLARQNHLKRAASPVRTDSSGRMQAAISKPNPPRRVYGHCTRNLSGFSQPDRFE